MTKISPRFRSILPALLGPLVLSACSVAGAGEGNAATEPAVTPRSGKWLVEGSRELAKSHFMGHEEACVESGNKPEFLRLVVDGLMRKDLEQTGAVCKGEPAVRSGNLVTSELSCSDPEHGTIKVAARGVIAEQKINVRYTLDLSKVRADASAKAKILAKMEMNPLGLTARRVSACTA